MATLRMFSPGTQSVNVTPLLPIASASEPPYEDQEVPSQHRCRREHYHPFTAKQGVRLISVCVVGFEAASRKESVTSVRRGLR